MSEFWRYPQVSTLTTNGTDPTLLERLIESARNHVMTPAERIAQKRSWVRGEMMLSHPEMTAAQVDQLLDEALPELARNGGNP